MMKANSDNNKRCAKKKNVLNAVQMTTKTTNLHIRQKKKKDEKKKIILIIETIPVLSNLVKDNGFLLVEL